jgi:hypothetical protein
LAKIAITEAEEERLKVPPPPAPHASTTSITVITGKSMATKLTIADTADTVDTVDTVDRRSSPLTNMNSSRFDPRLTDALPRKH